MKKSDERIFYNLIIFSAVTILYIMFSNFIGAGNLTYYYPIILFLTLYIFNCIQDKKTNNKKQ